MADKAVFLDRDHTIIDDPGYLADRGKVSLLPGVDVALKALSQGGYKLVVVTNQSGVARGLVTEEQLAEVHGEMQRQLGEKGITLDGIYYCPHHPEGVVEGYVGESDERKPSPGMLLRAARELDIDLAASWMIGDKPCDVTAGKRAGCRTIQVLHNGAAVGAAASVDESARPDYSVRNLPEASKIILPGAEPAETHKGKSAGAPRPSAISAMTDSEVLHELLQHARQLHRAQHENEFNAAKLVAGIFQVLAGLALLMVLVNFGGMGAPQADLDKFYLSLGWIGIAAVLQLVALTFFVIGRRR